MLSWFAIPFYAVRLGFEAQNAAAIGLLRLAAGASMPLSRKDQRKC